MRRAMTALPAAVLLACGGGVGPATDLTGRWVAQWVESSDVLDLVQDGERLTGSGTYYRFINPPTGTFTVTGTYRRPDVTLTIRYDSGLTTTFAGVVADDSRFGGVERYPGGAADSLTFDRR